MTAPLKSLQIKDFIKRQILSGALGEGERIDTVRRLAEKFSVSRQAVDSAFDQLESEDLIERKGRAGVYVKSHGYPAGASGVFLLAYDVDPSNRYLNEIVRISCPPHLRAGFTFLTRIIPHSLASPRLLDMELARLEQMRELDCVLVVPPPDDQATLAKLDALRVPTLFLGEFAGGRGGLRHQITDDNQAIAATCAKHLLEQGAKELALVIGDLSLDFNAEFRDVTQHLAAAHEARLHIMEMDYQDGPTTYVAKLMAARRPDAFLNFGCNSGHLLTAMATNGVDAPVLAHLPLDNANVETCVADFSALFPPVFERIAALKRGEAPTPKRLVIPVPLAFVAKDAATKAP